MIHLFRFVLVFLAVNSAIVGLTFLFRFYEAESEAALAGRDADGGADPSRRRFTADRLARGLGAWARETALLSGLLLWWPTAILPRPRPRPGSWLPGPREVRLGVPVLLVPGYSFNRATLELLRRRLEAAHRPALAIDLPLRRSIPELAALIETAAIELKAATGAERIDLVCHSRGGVAAHWWLRKEGGAAHVERCVTLGSPLAGTRLAAFAFGPSGRDLMPGSDVCRALDVAPLPAEVRFHAVNGGAESFVLPPGNDDLRAPGVTVRIHHVGHCGLLVNAGVWHAIHAALRRRGEAALDDGDAWEDESTDEAAVRAIARFPQAG